MNRTRVKICGIRRPEDALLAAQLGADAIGMVFYADSARAVSVAEARALRAALPPLVSTVALFVNAQPAAIDEVVQALRPSFLQFHGDESNDFCGRFSTPFVKAIRVGGWMTTVDLLQCQAAFPDAHAILLDTLTATGYGGTGESFDWTLIPPTLRPRLILSGGLNADNVGQAIVTARPWAVDVSSGVEGTGRVTVKGIKDAHAMARFFEAVRRADAALAAATN